GRKSKVLNDEDGQEISTEIKSRKEFTNKAVDRLTKISQKMIDDEAKDAFGNDDHNGEKSQGHRRNKKTITDLSEETGRLTWEEAEKVLAENSHYGISKVRELRHVAFPYHQITSIPKSLEFIANAQVGKFRRQVAGIVMAVGEISAVKALRVIDDQNVFHFDATIEQIVFRPKKDVQYETVVTMISPRLITSSLFGQITVTTALNDAAKAVLKGVTLTTGDTILVKYTNSTVKRSICVLQGTLMRLVKRGGGGDFSKTPKKAKKLDKDDGEEKIEKKEEEEMETEVKMEVDDDYEVKEKKAKKKKKEKRVSSDEDSD
ncbi:hypothetical protein PFISCL1PPCAC_9964, partial [Pristionchus fissidentatus]